jgi:hypothetical protein
MMLAFLSFAVMIAGLVIYYASTQNLKTQEIGKMAFFAGLLAFLLQNGGRIVDFLGRAK